jgi:hypothetical protein
MRQALRSGLSVAEFWEMTPAETYAVIEAANWREDQRLRQQVAMARLTASLVRAKRLPSLGSLLAKFSQPQKSSKKELRQRRRAFKKVASAENIRRINEHVKKRETDA